MTKTSESTKEIAAALAKAQGEIQNPSKDSINPHFKNHYADIASGLNAVRAPLARNGIAYTQSTRMDGNILMLDTRLTHSSGEWMESEYPVCAFPAPQQQIGSALTYSRRYSLFGLVGIAGEDDDGEGAVTAPVPKQEPRKPPARIIDDAIPFSDPEPETDAAIYAREAHRAISEWTGDAIRLKSWWAEEAPHRERAGVVNGAPEYAPMFKAFIEKGKALSQKKAA